MNYIIPIIVGFNSISALFNLMLNANIDPHEKFPFVMQLYSLIPNKENCTAVVLYKFLKKLGAEVKMEVDSQIPLDIKAEPTLKDLKSIESAEKLGEKLGQMLMQQDARVEKTGLLVDWLSAVELEIANSDKQKLQVLFCYFN